MKEIKIVAILILGLLFSYTAFAQTSTSTADQRALILQIQEQIKILEAKIIELHTELKTTQSELVEVKEELRLTRTLRRGMTGEDVSQLQKFFKQFPDIYPEGLVTGFFGPLTEAAVQRFQEKQAIVSFGSPETTGFGQIGPKTVSKLNELVAEGVGPSGKIPFGLTLASRIQDKPTEEIQRTPVASTSTPSGAIPATPAEVATTSPADTSTPAIPAVSVLPASPVTGTSATPVAPSTTTQPSTSQSQDITPPTISNVQATDITTTFVTIAWTTNESASSEIYYALSSPVTATSTIKTTGADNVVSHSVGLTGLSSGKTHYYVAVSKDAAGNTATSSEQSFATATPPPPPTQCNDGLDNDSDGLIDLNDSGCSNALDNDETNPVVKLNWPIMNISGSGYDPEIAQGNSGYGVVWATVGDDTRGDVYFAVTDTNGNNIGQNILVSEGLSRAGHPSIARGGNEYAIVWGDKRNDGTWSRLYFARYDNSGQKIGHEVQLNTHSIGHSFWPRLVWNGSEYGLFWVTSAYTSNYEVYFMRISATGEKLTGDIRMTNNGSGNTTGLSVVWTGAEYGLAYQFPVASVLPNVFFQRVNSNGNKLGEQLKLTAHTVSGPYPSIGWNGSNYAVVWKEQGEKNGLVINQIAFVTISSIGQLINASFYIQGVEYGGSPILIGNGSGYGMVWKDGRIGGIGDPLYFTELNSGGVRTRGDVQLSETGAPIDQFVISNSGKYAVVWENSGGGIYFSTGN